MILKDVLISLGERGFDESRLVRWDEAMLALPSRGPSFLRPSEIRVSRRWCGFDAGCDSLLEDAARRITANPALLRMAWYFYWYLFETSEPAWTQLPSLRGALGDDEGILYLLVALGFVPRLRNYHRLLGVPPAITRETCRQVRCFCENHERAFQGRLGVFGTQVPWLRNYVRGNLYFRIGRFEYWAEFFPGGLRAFRHRHTGAVVALADADIAFTRDGWAEPPAEALSPDSWKSSFQMDAGVVRGLPLSPWGKAAAREVSLPLDLWRPVLAKGDPVLSMHIPSGGNMSLDECRQSMTRAVKFFRRYFPERPPVAITCSSWVFSPLLEQILTATSNLVAFQRELYLHPHPTAGPASLWFVFLQRPFDIKTAPRETRLQRAILGFLEAGHTWRNGSMFILTEDLAHFGEQHYRNHWPREIPWTMDAAEDQRAGD